MDHSRGSKGQSVWWSQQLPAVHIGWKDGSSHKLDPETVLKNKITNPFSIACVAFSAVTLSRWSSWVFIFLFPFRVQIVKPSWCKFPLQPKEAWQRNWAFTGMLAAARSLKLDFQCHCQHLRGDLVFRSQGKCQSLVHVWLNAPWQQLSLQLLQISCWKPGLWQSGLQHRKPNCPLLRGPTCRVVSSVANIFTHLASSLPVTHRNVWSCLLSSAVEQYGT